MNLEQPGTEPKNSNFEPKKLQFSGSALKVEPEKVILEYFTLHPEGSYTDVAQAAGVSRSTIMRLLKELRHKGQVRHLGPKKGGRWEVLQPGPDPERDRNMT